MPLRGRPRRSSLDSQHPTHKSGQYEEGLTSKEPKHVSEETYRGNHEREYAAGPCDPTPTGFRRALGGLAGAINFSSTFWAVA